MVPIGLANMGNTCYLNAALSVLIQTDWLKRKMDKGEGSPFIELVTDINTFLQTNSTHASLMLPETVKWARRMFGSGPQCTIDVFTKIVNIPDPETLKDDCELVSISTHKVTCTSCGNVSTAVEKPTIIIAFEKKTERFEGYDCDICCKLTSANKTQVVTPTKNQNIVVVAIPRTNAHELHDYAKLITFKGFVLRGFTICVGGHHVAAVNVSNEWYIVNDESVKNIDGSEIKNQLPKAHVMVFERIC